MPDTPAKDTFDFEAGIKRLEEIIDLFDEGGLTLDQMESFFIEGMNLVKKCSERLDRVENRIAEFIDGTGFSWQDNSPEE